jgi:hypothetical protein
MKREEQDRYAGALYGRHAYAGLARNVRAPPLVPAARRTGLSLGRYR